MYIIYQNPVKHWKAPSPLPPCSLYAFYFYWPQFKKFNRSLLSLRLKKRIVTFQISNISKINFDVKKKIKFFGDTIPNMIFINTCSLHIIKRDLVHNNNKTHMMPKNHISQNAYFFLTTFSISLWFELQVL